MFIILLRFSTHKSRASELMSAHNAWMARGFEEGVFLLVGSLQPKLGGAILAHGETRADLLTRLNADPFVAQGVVEPEVFEVSPVKAVERFSFLLGRDTDGRGTSPNA